MCNKINPMDYLDDKDKTIDNLEFQLEYLKKQFRELKVIEFAQQNKSNDLSYQIIIDSRGLVKEIKFKDIPDNTFITILKERGYEISKKF
jgi:hypothetical protein